MGPKILIIDDSASIHELVKTRLRYDSIEVISAPDGITGIGLSTSAAPDLILLDVDMPGLDGFEVCRRLKNDPATSGIPVLFLTAEAKIAQKVRGLGLGAVDYVTKPFDSTELRARVHASLRNKKKQDVLLTRVMLDDLTRLWNSAYFEYRLGVSTAEAHRFNRALACILIDVDHLSAINARFSRDVGDEVLRTLAARILESSRTEDTVSRLSGGTFAVLSPNTSGPQAVRFAERLWLYIQPRPFLHGNISINFKCSFGVACLDESAETGIMQQSRQALLRAKNIGGARIALAEPQVTPAAAAQQNRAA